MIGAPSSEGDRHVDHFRFTIFAAIAIIACDSAGSAPAPTIDRRTESTQSDPSVVVPIDPISADVALDPRVPAPLGLDVCGPIATTTCRMHLGCRTGATRDSLESCEAHLRATCERELPRLEARIEKGLLKFDPSALRTCEAKLEMLECSTPARMQAALGDACDAVFSGRLGEGDACTDAGDCAPGLACMSNGACPGRCEALRPLGAACNAELAPCADGLSCEAGTCKPASVALGAGCVSSAQCPEDAFCGGSPDDTTCRPKVLTGRACDDDEQCQPSDYCQMLLGEEVGLGSCATRLGLNQACDPLLGGCAEGLACDETRLVCSPPPDIAGMSCVDGAAPCGTGTGLVCDAGLCELEPFIGDACDPALPSGCRFGFCNASDLSGGGTCQSFRAPLEACSTDAECGALACVDGRCDRPERRCHATLRDINLGFRFRLR